MATTPRGGYTYHDTNALQAEVPLNDNLLREVATNNLQVVSATTAAQPGSPTTGDAYILPTSPSGAQWSGFTAGNVAIYDGSTWTAFAAYGGMSARAADTGELYFCTAANTWVTLSTLLGSKGTDIASATTTNIAAATGDYVHITGTTTITAFDTAKAGLLRTLRFAGVLTLTHNATSLILPGASNITTAANDTCIMRSEGSGNWRCIAYQKADGTPLVLTVDAVQYKGAWNASTNTPTLADGSGNTGDFYRVSVAGTQDLGSGSVSYGVGDTLIYSGSVWDHIPSGNSLTSADVTTALGFTPQERYQAVNALGNQSGAVAVDLDNGLVVTMTLTGNVTITFSNVPSSSYRAVVTLYITQDGTGGRTVGITSAKYPSGVSYTATSTASATDIVEVHLLAGGSTIYAFPVENMG